MVNNDSMDMILAKAQTLIEALPYIQKFNGKRVVVKYGGSAMVDENLKYNVIKDVALLKLIGMEPIIVHGGGKEISAWLKKIGKESEFVNGLRVTDEETPSVECPVGDFFCNGFGERAIVSFGERRCEVVTVFSY